MKLESSTAIEFLRALVAIPSLSHQETEASTWLVDQMRALGYQRAYVDAAGNAVGELGPPDAAHTVVLLGHIDTVPGNIPVRIEETDDGPVLYGRGAVDAKGPLATFTAAVARLGAEWAAEQDLRLVVVGAVEEEAATSKGARFIRDRFNGVREPIPDACIIGEPSNWRRVTLGYKGRILVELTATQPMAHTAGPDAGVATVAVALWNWINDYAVRFNAGRDKAFDQLLPSLRRINTWTDEAMNDHVTAQIGIRLPLNFDADHFTQQLLGFLSPDGSTPATFTPQSAVDSTDHYQFTIDNLQLTIHLYAHEPAWQSDRNNTLVRSFQRAIREADPDTRPGFVNKTGTSDMNVIGPAWQCPIVAYGPGDSALDHTPNEHLSLAEYERTILILEAALRNLATMLS